MASEYADYLADRGGPHRNTHALTTVEVANLRWFSHGLHRADVARARCVSEETVKSQIDSARMKLGAKTTAHAVAIALRHGLIQ